MNKQRFLIGEVEVERADGYVGLGYNVTHRGGVIAFGGEDPHGGLHHGCALGVFLLAGFFRATVGHDVGRNHSGIGGRSQRDPAEH